ncbi:hypothetical protein E5676_scaffold491G00060 [Cucumis melo var. makuwa]|uniref:Uncharacterized protein n=1 Tax=Cucumis melo var. makuwa TaxID=1194695 RepID=A0A5A7VDQ5_CUCMM|nr:hypothetical protein E6C27_scaffold1343G00180 [Cucumis melo var. makuwa]TYJ97703.1 hypothetical protein E5676_scaffold491G00060 [Cucumis melo var. makuwa]
MFPEEEFLEQSMFHEGETTNETEKTFEKGEYCRQVEDMNIQVPEYFFRFQELMLASHEAVNIKMGKLFVEVEGLKNF